MNTHTKGSVFAVVMPLTLGIFLSSCATGPQPENKNTTAQSNQNASDNVNPAPGASAAPPAGVHTGAPEGWVDDVKGEAKAGGSITVSGWAADVEDGAPVRKVEVLLDNDVVAQATLGKDRLDVVKVSGRPDWRRSGWEATVSLANVSKGAIHKVAAVAYDSAGNKGALNGARDIDVAAR